MVYKVFDTICGFRHPQENLERTHMDKGGLLYLFVCSFVFTVLSSECKLEEGRTLSPQFLKTVTD